MEINLSSVSFRRQVNLHHGGTKTERERDTDTQTRTETVVVTDTDI